MVSNKRARYKPISSSWGYRGATVIYYATLVVRALYPIFVWSFYALTFVLLIGALSSDRRQR
jgi:hypothetical protein